MKVIIHFNKNSRIRELNKVQVTTLLSVLLLLFIGLIAIIISFALHNSSSNLISENKELKNTIKNLNYKLNEIQKNTY